MNSRTRKETGQHAGNAAARKTDSDGNGSVNLTNDGREFQGVTNARHKGQHPPRCAQPAGTKALRWLEVLWGAPRAVQRYRGRT